MRIFKYRTFRQWTKSEKLSDSSLINAINEMERGLFEANLGNGLYKKRIARKGQGKRVADTERLLPSNKMIRAIFMYGYAKNERDNIHS